MKNTLKILVSTFILSLWSMGANAQENEYIPNLTSRHDAVLYPNPTSNGQVKIKSAIVIKNVELISMIGEGEVVLDNKLHIFDEMTLKISDLHPGIYLAKITFEDNKSIIKKLVVR
jgi:hypothetical protein